MAAFLTSEWLEAVRPLLADHPPPTGGDAHLHVVISDGPHGDVKLGDQPAAHLGLTVPAKDLSAMVDGSLEPSVAFMQGRLKTTGDTGALFRLLAWTRTPAYGDLRAAVRAITDA